MASTIPSMLSIRELVLAQFRSWVGCGDGVEGKMNELEVGIYEWRKCAIEMTQYLSLHFFAAD